MKKDKNVPMRRDAFAGRYFIKIISSIIVTGINAVLQLILPRALSVAEYGYYSYNLNVFTAVVSIASLSVPNALSAKFSRRNGEIGIIKFYLKFFLVMSIMLNVAIGIVCFFDTGLFAGQTAVIILLGMNVAVINNLLNNTYGIYNSLAVSRFPAIVQIIEKIAACVIVTAIYGLGILNLKVFYICHSCVVLSAIAVLLTAVFRDNRKMYPEVVSKSNREYLKEFYIYCQPLVLPACLAPILEIFSNSILMRTAGEKAQAMFGISLQLNTLINYIFSPYAELMKREYSVLQDNMEEQRRRFVQSMRQMFWVSGYFAVFILVCADWIILLLFGDKYQDAVFVTRLIMGYTIYQAMGQLCGGFLLSTEQTKLQARLNYLSMLLTLAFLYIFQVPNFIFPDGLGAVGIGLKYMVLNFITTGIFMTFCMKYLKLNKKVYLYVQGSCLIVCFSFAFFARFLFGEIFGQSSSQAVLFVKVFLSGIIYTLGIGIVIWLRPELIGVTKKQLRDKVSALKLRLIKNQ